MSDKEKTSMTLETETFERMDELSAEYGFKHRNSLIDFLVEKTYKEGISSEESVIGETLKEGDVYLLSVNRDSVKYLVLEDGELKVQEKTL